MNTPNLKNLVRDERGANMVEYIILVGIVAILGIAGFRLFSGSVTSEITDQGKVIEGVPKADPGH